MLSIKPLQSAKSACDYYLAAFNYYQGDSTAIAWLGKGKEYLNLNDEVEQTTMLRLLQGVLPDGSKLQNNRGEHRPGFDMTFSAPKSVSILVGLGVAPELVHFHDEAVKYALSQIEAEFTEARFVRDGEIHYQKTGNLLAATFRQPSSRANEPALHTHCVTMNITFCDDKAKSLASDKLRIHGVVEQIQNNAHYCGLLYRHHLANSLKTANFSLRMVGDGLFEINGVPEELLREFSSRREDIVGCMDKNGWIGAKAASQAALITRQNKEEQNLTQLKHTWKERALELGFDAEAFMQNRSQQKETSNSIFTLIKDKLKSLFSLNDKEPTEEDIAAACVQVAIETLSQRTSVFSDRALKAQSLKHSLIYDAVVSEEAITTAILHEKKTNKLYETYCPDTNQTLLTTPWLLTLEAESLARIEHNKGKMPSIATRQEVRVFQDLIDKQRTHPMTGSQKEAILTILTSKDRYLAVQGYAGVAKTTMLAEARNLIESKGFTLRGITVASSAAEELQIKAGIRSDVFPIVHQELKTAARGSLSKTVFIVDEASMLSSSQGHELIKRIESTQARLVFVGDKAQLPSVNNGRLFGLTQEYGIEAVVMNEIVRQKNKQALQSVIHATRGEIKESIENLHHVEEIESHHERIEWITNHWLSKSVPHREETLLFAPTHRDRAEITALIRKGLENEGALTGTSYFQEALKIKTMEAVQQRFVAYYQQGDVIRFNQDFHQSKTKRGHYYRVGQITHSQYRDNILPLIDEKGKTHSFALKHLPQYKSHTASFERILEIYRPQALELKVGDKVLWSRNAKKEGVHNGQRATLIGIHEKDLHFKADDGQEMIFPKTHPALKHLDHGYVLTNYKVQGKDGAYAVGLMESQHRFSATLKNFYVQISRAVHEMTLVTDNKEHLIAAIKRNKDEKLASLDIVSKDRLKMHEAQFKNKNSISMQSVIDKKKHFEVNAVFKAHDAGNKSEDLEYFKNHIPNKNLSPIEKNKELERN